jgi:predicted  nucleic acid-binding Zn-ribbon protein
VAHGQEAAASATKQSAVTQDRGLQQMTLGEELAVLYDVQQADLEIARLKAALAGLDTGEEIRAQIGAAEEELAALQRQLQTSETEHRDRDLELKTLQEKRERFERQLYSGTVRNPRELSDLQGEVAMLTREGDRVELRVIELMLEVEQQRTQVAEKQATLAEMQERLGQVVAAFQTTAGRLQAEIAELEGQRRGLAARVGSQTLKRYEQIRARQNNLALVKVTSATCPACRVSLPSERLKAIKAGEAGETCDNCGRLLLWGGPAD